MVAPLSVTTVSIIVKVGRSGRSVCARTGVTAMKVVRTIKKTILLRFIVPPALHGVSDSGSLKGLFTLRVCFKCLEPYLIGDGGREGE